MADFGTNFAAIPHGRGVEIRSLSLECAKPSPTSRQAVGRLWKSTAQVLSGRKVEVHPPRRGGNAKVGQVGDERRVRPPRRGRDVKRREEKPRRERRRVCSRSLGGRRGTHANRNNATDGQTPGRQRRRGRVSPEPEGRAAQQALCGVRLIYLQPANYGKLLRSPRPVVVSFSSLGALAGRALQLLNNHKTPAKLL